MNDFIIPETFIEINNNVFSSKCIYAELVLSFIMNIFKPRIHIQTTYYNLSIEGNKYQFVNIIPLYVVYILLCIIFNINIILKSIILIILCFLIIRAYIKYINIIYIISLEIKDTVENNSLDIETSNIFNSKPIGMIELF